jgi:hypothetical protein
MIRYEWQTAYDARYGNGCLCGHWLIWWTSATSRSRGIASVTWHSLAAIDGLARIPLPRMCSCGRDSYQQRFSAIVHVGYKSIHQRGEFICEGVGSTRKDKVAKRYWNVSCFLMESSYQARSQGVAIGRNEPTTNLDAPNKNLQNIKDQPADQPLKKCTTLPHPHLPFV